MITVYGYLGRLSPALIEAAASAELVVGGARHLDALGVPADRRVVLGKIAPAIEAIAALGPDADVVVVASGDPLFHGVVRQLRQGGLTLRVVPEVTSLQAAFAAVALPWDDAVLVSAHGKEPGAALDAVRRHPKVGVLPGKGAWLADLVAATAGQGRTFVVGERFGEDGERVRVLSEDEARVVDDIAEPHVILVLAHHPDDPAALDETASDVPAAEPEPARRAAGDPARIGQLTNSPASRARADAIDAILGPTRRYDGPARENLPRAWAECDLIVSHLALGATTRLVAPLLADKHTDPGVVVVDEAGRFAIPLVGGHVGGANDLARQLADGLGATAVLTTATDALGLPGLDTLGWDTSGDLAGVTRAVLDGRPVELVRARPWPLPALPENVVEAGEASLAPEARIVVTDGVPDSADVATVVLHPRGLVVGMGCNRGTSADALEALLDATLAEAGLARASIAVLTTVDAKASEPGLLELAGRLGVPLRTHASGVLAELEVPNPSDAPAKAVGTPSVAEASVLAEGAELVVDKRKTPEATCAIGRLAPRGRLSIVGLGPGADDLLTPRARRVLAEASVVIGYRPYVAQIKHLLRPGTKIVNSRMGDEAGRTAQAIATAREGRRVALVTGGDPAIYAMASPTLEQGTEGIDVEVVPGVTAELAASAILGAPLGHDHATISLSDLHTDWASIERRLLAAAEADLVVALYNPRSHKRVTALPRALEIFAGHRPAGTPVAVVRDASRPEQSVRVGTLAEFDPEWVDMHSIVIVGSSTTRLVPTGSAESFLVTPRDYRWMNA